MNDPLVSVIIPAYNAAGFINRSIQSAINQTYQHLEIIVVDDGSTDQTREILSAFEARIRWFTQPNQGPSAARNAGFKASTGDLIAFLDADDFWFPEKIEKQVEVFRKQQSVGLVFCDALYKDERGNRIARAFELIEPKEGWIFPELFTENFIPTLTVMIRRSCLQEIGLFDETLLVAQDYDLWLRASRITAFAFVREPLAEYLIHPNQVSSKEEEMIQNLLQIKECLINHIPEVHSLSMNVMDKGYFNLYLRYAKFYLHQDKRDKAREILSVYQQKKGPTFLYLLIYILSFMPNWLVNKVIDSWNYSKPTGLILKRREMDNRF
jgi:glycosyltransferase involved in cell wall biosynthesis